jgi:hypothetical protein
MSPLLVAFQHSRCAMPPQHLAGAAQPSVASVNDPGPVNLGVKFRPDVNGWIAGIRFYKGQGNTGQHVGSLWTADGTLLGPVTFARNRHRAGR